MADRTRTEAIQHVLQDLGALGRAGNVSSADETTVQSRYDDAIVVLRNADVIDIVDPVNAIPEGALNALVAYLVQECAPAFHAARDLQVMELAKRRLRSADRASRTVADTVAARLATRILRQLEWLGVGEAPSDRELAIIADRTDATLMDLAQRNIIAIGSVDDVEQIGAFDALADYMTALGMREFQQEGQIGRVGPLSVINRQDAERRLRRLGAADPGFAPLVVSYF